MATILLPRTPVRLAGPALASKRRHRLQWFLGLAAVLALFLVSSAMPQTPPPAATRTTVPPQAAAKDETPAASPMDEPLRLIAEARKIYDEIRDYSCVLIKKERLRGQLQPESVITMKVRNQPFSVYLRWQQPKEMAGQEACYVAGKNNGMMRVHANGLRGVAGWVTLDPNDTRAKQSSNHSITEAGIGNLIGRFEKTWQKEKQLNLTRVRVGEYEYNKRRCTRVEAFHPDNSGGQFISYRTIMYFDKETHLPIRLEVYDWPKKGGNADGDVMEIYSYINMKTNVGFGEESFDY
jgi:hypothetical protein